MATVAELERQAEKAKKMLDGIDELIDADNSRILDGDVMRARAQYSREWMQLVELIRKAKKDAKPAPSASKLDFIRSKVS